MMPGRYAAIDIGTVTCRMLVASVHEDGTLIDLDREYAIVNLGEGVDATGVLKPEAMARALAAVESYVGVIDRLEGETGERVSVTAMATSAARDAANADEFAAALAALGVSLAVIPGAREAALSFMGASSCFPGERLIVVDVGGGSTEVIAGMAGGAPEYAHSFDIGCRRVTERFFHTDPPAPAELDAARAWIREIMAPYFHQLRDSGFMAERMVAVAGTATSVVSVHEAMEVYDTERVHKALVPRAELDAVFDRLASVPQAERESVVGLDPGRAPVIVAGLVILQEVMTLGGFDSFTVSESDILHGIILDAAREVELSDVGEEVSRRD